MRSSNESKTWYTKYRICWPPMMLYVLSHSQVICDQYYTSNLNCQLNCQLQKEAGFSCSPANKETQPLYIIIIKIYFYKRTAQWFIYNRIYWIFTNNNWNLFIFVVISKSNKKLSIYFHAFRFDWRKLPFARLSFSPPAQNQTSCLSEYWPRFVGQEDSNSITTKWIHTHTTVRNGRGTQKWGE